jgi:hypothetical protein
MLRDHGTILSLQGSGSALWHVLARPRSLAESAELLAGHYQVPVDEIERDIAPVVEELSSHGALLSEVHEG